MELQEQIKLAVDLITDMFHDHSPGESLEPPEDATVESLWAELRAARAELNGLKRLKRGVRPKVESAVKVLLEDNRLAEVSVPLIADIIKKVFTKHGVRCDCSESSVRWYMSQRNLEWNIIRRRLPQLEVKVDAEPSPETKEEPVG